MMTIDNITSIGWLNSTNGNVRLTPCFNGHMMPVFITIKKEEFETLNGDKILMKKKAIEKINQ